MALYEGFEIAMLLTFSCGWYWSIARMLRTGTAGGKSAMHVMCACSGYGFGVASKLAIWSATGELSPVVWLYVWNMVVIGVDLTLVLRLTRRPGRPWPMRPTLAV